MLLSVKHRLFVPYACAIHNKIKLRWYRICFIQTFSKCNYVSRPEMFPCLPSLHTTYYGTCTGFCYQGLSKIYICITLPVRISHQSMRNLGYWDIHCTQYLQLRINLSGKMLLL